jgi:hypothetical protein
MWEPPTVQKRQLPPCSKTGDIYTLHIVPWPWNIYTSATQPAPTAKTRVGTG